MDGWAYHHLSPSATPARKPSTTKPTLSSPAENSDKKQPYPRSLTARPFTLEARKRTSGSENADPNELQRLRSSSFSSAGPPFVKSNSAMTAPFTHRHGRRFLSDPSLPYPLPVDLAELHRQTIRTIMLMRVFGAPFCSTFFEDTPPTKVLEIACGSALWSSACHDYFKAQGYTRISFTGVDIAPLAPDLKRQGLNWRFVQHDVRKRPWPFADGEFDFIFFKDADFCVGAGDWGLDPLSELRRMLKPGGVLEAWNSNHQLRTLLPNQPTPHGTTEDEIEQAEETATYIISSGTAFAKAQNSYLQDYNRWVAEALERRRLSAVPCARLDWLFSSSEELFKSIGSRRVAIPFGEVRWEREGVGGGSARLTGHESAAAPIQFSGKSEQTKKPRRLTPAQAALRQTALLTTIQFIEAMELVLKEASGKRSDEWDRWWAGTTSNLLKQNGTFNGECLEIGAWWAQKI